MRAREQVAAALANGLPTNYRVIDHSDSLDRIEAREVVVMVYQNRLRPHLSSDRRMVDLDVWVLVPHLDPGPADDAADDALDVVTGALDAVPFATWTEAERGVFSESFHGYKITVTATTTKG